MSSETAIRDKTAHVAIDEIIEGTRTAIEVLCIKELVETVAGRELGSRLRDRN
jgi:hypothetical protein